MGRGTAECGGGACRSNAAPPPCGWSPSPRASHAGRTRNRLDIVLGGGAGHQRFGDLLLIAAYRPLDPLGHLGILLEVDFGVLAALANPHRIVAEPGARFLDDA